MNRRAKTAIEASENGRFIIEPIPTVFARLTGRRNVHDLSLDDLMTVNSEIAAYTDIPHV